MPLNSKTHYEMTILEECTYAHMRGLMDPLLKPCMEDPRHADAKLVSALWEAGYATAIAPHVLTTTTLRAHARAIVVGDVVLYCNGGDKQDILVGEVYCHASIHGECVTCVSQWNIVERSKHWMKAIVVDNPGPIPSVWLLQSIISTPVGVGKKAIVLLPCDFS